LRGEHLTAVAGTARPGVFFDMLRARGIEPAREVGLPDHAAPSDYATLIQDRSHTLLCTEKDAVKVFPMVAANAPGQHPQVWAVPLELSPEPAFFLALDTRLQALKRGA
jgi:tetraacyldisaccharide 4'-kinase